MAYLLGLASAAATFLGGLFALRGKDRLRLILGFSAGAVMGVAFFDLLPESLELAGPTYGTASVAAVIASGFFLFMLLSRVILLHPHEGEGCANEHHKVALGAGSLSLHSFLDGLGIGLAFRVSPAVGAIVAAAVLAHDFSDGINTVGIVLRGHKDKADRRAVNWLLADAFAPFLGIVVGQAFAIPSPALGLLLAVFCGFFLYIGASDLLPESHRRHPRPVTSLMTVLGAALIYLAVRLATGL